MSYDKNNPTPVELLAYVAYATANAPETMGIIRMRDVTLETKRQNDKRPAEAVLSVQDDVVKALRGRPERGPEVLIVVVPRHVCDAHEKREERRASPIILPGDEVAR